MPVKIGKLWKDSEFQSFSRLTKLLYIYLSTNPNLNTVGVFSPILEVITIELDCSMDDLRDSCSTLVDKGYIFVKKFNGVIYFIVPAHFDSIPKSESSVIKVTKVLNSLPEDLVSFLSSKGIEVKSKVREFKKPTIQEVTDFSLSKGYLINGREFVEYYDSQASKFGKPYWVDARGSQVRDWKAKLTRVWFRDEKKIPKLDGAPSGFEYFYSTVEGNPVFPDGWRNGKPYSKNLITDIELKKEYERRKKSS